MTEAIRNEPKGEETKERELAGTSDTLVGYILRDVLRWTRTYGYP